MALSFDSAVCLLPLTPFFRDPTHILNVPQKVFFLFCRCDAKVQQLLRDLPQPQGAEVAQNLCFPGFNFIFSDEQAKDLTVAEGHAAFFLLILSCPAIR